MLKRFTNITINFHFPFVSQFIQTTENDDQLYNSHIVINSDGQIMGVYHKVHLFDANLSTKETTPNIKVSFIQFSLTNLSYLLFYVHVLEINSLETLHF